MSSDNNYYVPVEVKDGSLSFLLDKMTEVLGQNLRLESIFQKYNNDYNTTFTDRVSVKTLQVRNQNHTPIFSSITSTGIIRSPVSSAKRSTTEKLRTPFKSSRISLNTERKRLSFHEPEEDSTALTHVFPKNRIDSQPLFTNPNLAPIRVNVDERKTAIQMDTSPPFLSYRGKTKISDSPNMYKLERLNPLGKPETITSHSVYEDNAYSLDKTPDKHQPTVIIPEEKNRTHLSSNFGKSTGSNLEINPSFSSKTVATASGRSHAHGKLMFNLDESIGAIIKLALKETPAKTPEKLQTMVTSFEKIKTPLKTIACDRSRVKPSVISPSHFRSDKQVRDSNQLYRNSQESFHPDEKLEFPDPSTEPKRVRELGDSSSLSLEHERAILMSYRTSDKGKTMFRGVNRKERTPENSVGVKTVIVEPTSKEQEFPSPKSDVNTPHIFKVNKRKSVSYSGETITQTRLVFENQKSVIPSKIAKLYHGLDGNDKTTTDPVKYSTIAVKEILNPVNNSPIDEKSVHPVDDTAMNDNESFNSVKDTVTDDKEFSNHVDDTAMDKESFNNVEGSVMNEKKSVDTVDKPAMDDRESCNPTCYYFMHHEESFNSGKKSSVDGNFASNHANNEFNIDEGPHNITDIHVSKFSGSADNSETLTFASCLSPKENLKITARNISCLKKDQIKITNTREAPDFQSSSSLEQNLRLLVKRFFESSSQKSPTERSDSDNTSCVRQLCLRENPSETTTPPRDFVPNISSPKPESIYLTKVDEFCKMVNQSKNRMFNYRDLFLEDRSDLQFICSYLKQITAIVEVISNLEYKADIVEPVNAFNDKAWKLSVKASSWESEIERDLLVFDDCYKKATKIQQEMEEIRIYKPSNLNLKDFERWETCLRGANKKASDVILLRDIRRPTILQFGYKIENVIQLLIQCLLVLGLIKPYSKVCSD